MVGAEKYGREAGKRTTLADVARLAGVDKAIISRVVNADPTLVIRSETRSRVLAAISELDYIPNAAARSLRTARARALGLFIPDFANPVYAEIIAGAESEALARGYLLLVGSADGTQKKRDYIDLLEEGRVDGVLIAGGAITTRQQELLTSRGVPWILVNRRLRQARRYAILDDSKAARIAVRCLLDLGHTRIAHIGGPQGADTAQRRRAGYVAEMRAAGLKDRVQVEAVDYTPLGGAVATARLFSGSSTAPTAVCVANLTSAIGVLGALHRLGVNVPGDVSVVALHELPMAEQLVPALSTVSMPLHKLGARAVELLLTTSPDETVEEVTSEPTKLVVRESTGPPRKRVLRTRQTTLENRYARH